MYKSKRTVRKRIELCTAEDASLWRYECVNEALKQNADILVRLIQSELLILDDKLPEGAEEYEPMKRNRQLEQV